MTLVAVAVVAILAGLGLRLFSPAPQAGQVSGVTNYSKLGAIQLKVGSGCGDGFTYAGCTGTALNKFLQGTCNAVQQTVGAFAATSTAQFYCAVPGVVAGDNVHVSLPPGAGANAFGSGSLFGGFELVSANATSTGFIMFSILNLTGAATSSFVQATTSVAYLVTD